MNIKINNFSAVSEGRAEISIDKSLNKEWLSQKEVIGYLGISSRTLQNYRDLGKLGFSKIGRKKIYYRAADINQLLNKNYHERFRNS